MGVGYHTHTWGKLLVCRRQEGLGDPNYRAWSVSCGVESGNNEKACIHLNPLRRSFDPVLWAILLLALALRLYRIDAPYVDAHSWRQVTNADIARLWTEIPIDIFFPQVSWGGPDGYAGMEFPLLHLVTALVWRAFGVSDTAGRLVAAAFSLTSVWLIYLLGLRLFNRAVGRGAALLLAFAPSYVYFGRTLLSDVPMVTFSIAAVLAYAKYFDTARHRDAVWGAIFLALAGLVKIPAILILGPIVWRGWLARRWKLAVDPWVVAGLIAAIGTIGLWYLHADRIFLETGLNQPVFRPSTVYTGDIAAHAGPFTTWEHWTVWGDPENGMRVRTLLHRFLVLHLTPIGAVVAAIGILRFRTPLRTVVDIWLLAGLSLVTVALRGQFPHEFHQLPLFPPLALYFGLGAQPFFDFERWSVRLPSRTIRLAAASTVVALALAVGIWSFLQSPVRGQLYRTTLVNTSLIDSGRAMEAATPLGALFVVVEYDRYGTNSPMLLYYARRRGWSFDANAIRTVTIDFLRDQKGACYFATSGWHLIEQMQPDVARYVLEKFREVPLSGAARGYRLFDLGCNATRHP
jgi:4-amino-4-deoxy-L-arabinose transferase-like glycosyltransferase